MARAWIGTSGYSYDHWSGPFYPRDLPEGRRFDFYAGHFGAVELNVTFYRLPLDHLRGWARRAAGTSLRHQGGVTPDKRLTPGARRWNAVRSGGRPRHGLACVLWRLHPFPGAADRLAAFLADIGLRRRPPHPPCRAARRILVRAGDHWPPAPGERRRRDLGSSPSSARAD
jgi:uncharacterized protein YecE (DUF72 family)